MAGMPNKCVPLRTDAGNFVEYASKMYNSSSDDARFNPDVSNGFHALAIDEVRSDFATSLWDETAIEDVQTVEQVWFAGLFTPTSVAGTTSAAYRM